MDEYTQSVDLKFISNIDDIVNQVKDLKKFSENMKANFTPSGSNEIKLGEEVNNSIFKFTEAVNDWVRTTEGMSELLNVQLPTSWAGMVTGLAKSFLNVFRKAWDELNEMISYNYLSDSNVRKLRLTYGLDAGEAYGYSKAADIMGISSLEDFSFMTDDQYALFKELSQEFIDMYDNYAEGDLSSSIYKFNVEMQKLKIEMLKPMLNVITNPTNRQIIQRFIEYLPQFLEALINIADGLTNWLDAQGYITEKRDDYREQVEKGNYTEAAESYNESIFGKDYDENIFTKLFGYNEKEIERSLTVGNFFEKLITAIQGDKIDDSGLENKKYSFIDKFLGKDRQDWWNAVHNSEDSSENSSENNLSSNIIDANDQSVLDLSDLYNTDAALSLSDTYIDLTIENYDTQGKKVSSKIYNDKFTAGQTYSANINSYKSI